MSRFTRICCAAFIGLILGCSAAKAPAQSTEPTPGAMALADRLAEMGQNTLRTPNITAASWMQSAALLEAACKLNPKEPRFPRMLAEALLQCRDVDGAIKALEAYRKIVPDSPAIQAQLIDLYISRMETADAKLNYLQTLLDSTKWPTEVRSVVATRIAALRLERSQVDKALAAIDQAIELNPINVAALKMRADLRFAGASPKERVRLLLDLILANPNQTGVIIDLAEQLARSGLSEESLYWYGIGLNLVAQTGGGPDPEMLAGYISELVLANERAAAGNLARQWLDANPTDIDVRFLQALIEKNSLKQENYEWVRQRARNVLTNALAVVRQQTVDASATTQPIESTEAAPIGDPVADVEKIKAVGDLGKLQQYISLLSDLAWLEIYFNENTQAAQPIIAAIESILGSESLTVSRLTGWSFLHDGKLDEAKVKLSAIAGRDPLAALGLVKIAVLEKAPDAVEQAQQLRRNNAAGLVGVFAWDTLQEQVSRIDPDPEVVAEMGTFPKDWMDILDQADKMYLIRGDPLKVSHNFGQPMLAKVVIENISKYDLSIGPDGVLKPDLWLDAQLRGIAAQNIQGAAYDRLANTMVLRRGKRVEQIVRVDQGDFARLMNTNPTLSIQAFISVTTNPVTSMKGLVSGPAGQRFQMPRIVERKGTPVGQEMGKAQVFATLSGGTPPEKMGAADLVGVVIRLIQAGMADQEEKGAGAEAMAQSEAQIGELIEQIRKTANDADENVQSWATFLFATLSDPQVSPQIVRAMETSPLWQKRLLVIAAMGRLTPTEQKELVARLAKNDPDQIVRNFALAAAERIGAGIPVDTGMDMALPATAPSTQPAVQIVPSP